MKQLAVISGKGGTGKTILSACFAVLAENKFLEGRRVDGSLRRLRMLAVGCVVLARSVTRTRRAAAERERRQQAPPTRKQERAEDLLSVDLMELEVGVGLIPAGGGCWALLERVLDGVDEPVLSNIPFIRIAFENMRMAKVATSR